MNKLQTVLLVVLIGIALVFGYMYFDLQRSTSGEHAGEYQAVFLESGQVYFGKLKHETFQYATLTDVYYLQIDEDISRLQADEVSRMRLIKLGGELHGPTDMMKINRDHIILIEDLRPDSNVVTAIKQSKTSQ